MKTDLDRLHNVIKTRPQNRQSGKTFARCHELAGAVGLGDTEIFCEITAYSDINYLKTMVTSVFQDHGLQIIWRLYEAHSGGSRIRFYPSHDFERLTRGWSKYTYIPMTHQD